MPAKKNRPSRLGRGLSSLMATPVEVAPPTAPAPAETVDSANRQKDTTHQSPTPQSNATQPAGTQNPTNEHGLHRIHVESIEPNRHQPRQRFDPSRIKALSESIASEGMMQPVVVRPIADSGDRYELVAGERRWRAAQQAGLEHVPALVREIDDEKAAEWALIENL
ncbi:MAG: ParB/RepB/Spo0J family partition protein [Phycisphaeraceae bacterium]